MTSHTMSAHMRSSALTSISSPAVAPPRSTPALVSILLLTITAIGALLRSLTISRKSFWLDEGVSVAIARLDWSNLLHILWRREANMGFYYLILRVWLHFGHSEAFIRALSLLFSVATIPVTYFLGKKLFTRKVGLIAASLLAAHAWQVRYAQ